MKFFNAKSPGVVIAFGIFFILFGAFYGASPFDASTRPAFQIITAVVIAAIGILFIVQGVGTRIRNRD